MDQSRWITESWNSADWLERISARIQEGDSGCWLWTSRIDRTGYGVLDVRKIEGGWVTIRAHRAAWMAYRGDIPRGLVTDHLCRVRHCVNPWHMDLVTAAINTARGQHSGSTKDPTRPEAVECRKHGKAQPTKLGPNSWGCMRCRVDGMGRTALRRVDAIWASQVSD
jgi:hypothetical protein